jgi:hypothetical protein
MNGRPARTLHDAGNDRSAERGSNLQVACCGSLTTPVKPAGVRVNAIALTPLPGTQSTPVFWFHLISLDTVVLRDHVVTERYGTLHDVTVAHTPAWGDI